MTLGTKRVQRNFTARDFSAARSEVEGSPWITGLMPDTAEVGGPDMEVVVSGGGFTDETVVVWGSSEVPVRRIAKSKLAVIIAPGTESAPGVVAVTVRTGELAAAEAVDFTYIDPIVPEATSEEIIAWVNNDANRATMALEAEEAYAEPRSGLVDQLEAVINNE